MKSLPGPTKLITLVAIACVSICAIIAFAGEKALKPPDKHSITLRMGLDGDKEPLHCSRSSLKEALKNCAPKSYKIHFHSVKDGMADEDLLKTASVSMPAKEIGGASPSPGKDRPSGVHSTQQVTFGDVEELNAFVTALKPEL